MKPTRTSPSRRVPKIIGSDTEFANFILGGNPGSTGQLASRLLLKKVPGVSEARAGNIVVADPQDIGRKWHCNGSCTYIDLDHLETCTAETRSAFDFAAAWHAQLRIVRAVQIEAQAELREGESVHVLACNTDGNASWGSHLNFLITRECFERIFHTHLHTLLWLASYHASSAIIHGQGKVGASNGAHPVDFQISQRADFLEEIFGLQTTYRRPIINCRNESLTEGNNDLARFHHIAHDVNLAQLPCILKTGIMQILLAMIETDAEDFDPRLILEDPVQACTTFSHDPSLEATLRSLDGRELSAVDHQRRFLDAASAFVKQGHCDDIVPRAADIVSLWADTLDLLARREWDTLSAMLDWVAKWRVLQEVISDNSELNWQSPEIRHLDSLYGSIDPSEGIYWSLEREGCIQRYVSDQEIDRFAASPPTDTRAYTRGNLLRLYGDGQALEINWDRLRLRVPTALGCHTSRVVKLDNPAGFTEADTGHLFDEDEPRILELSVPYTASAAGYAYALTGTTDMAGYPDAEPRRTTIYGVQPWR